jgi:hypothetical protein
MDFDLVRLLNSDSFDSFWYWLIIAVSWSRATHFMLGVGLHDVRDALRNGGTDMSDVEMLIHINARKLTRAMDRYGVWLTAVGTFLIAGIATLGFRFDIELMQASTFLFASLTLGSLVSLRFAYRVIKDDLQGKALCDGFSRFRTIKQFVGIASIFVISFYAAYFIVILRGL